jgi:hypothetical protein
MHTVRELNRPANQLLLSSDQIFWIFEAEVRKMVSKNHRQKSIIFYDDEDPIRFKAFKHTHKL